MNKDELQNEHNCEIIIMVTGFQRFLKNCRMLSLVSPIQKILIVKEIYFISQTFAWEKECAGKHPNAFGTRRNKVEIVTYRLFCVTLPLELIAKLL